MGPGSEDAKDEDDDDGRLLLFLQLEVVMVTIFSNARPGPFDFIIIKAFILHVVRTISYISALKSTIFSF